MAYLNKFWIGATLLSAVVFNCTKAERDNPFDPGAPNGISKDTLDLLIEYNSDCKKDLATCIQEAQSEKTIAEIKDQQKINEEFFNFIIENNNIEINNPDAQNTVGTSTIQLRGTLDPKNQIRVFDINDETVDINNKSWEIILNLEPGVNNINVLLFDDEANQFEINFTINYVVEAADSEAPIVTYNTANGATVNLPSLKFDGTYSDRSDILTFKVNGKDAELSDGEWYVYLSLVEGDNQVIVDVVDNSPANNRFLDTLNIAYSITDVTAPEISIKSPTSSDVLNIQTNVPVSGTAKDNGQLESVIVNGVEATIQGENWSAQVDLEDVGNNKRITAIARDVSGNEATDIVLVGYDPTAGDLLPPSVLLISHNSTEVYHVANTTLEFRVTDPSGIASVTVNGSAATLADTNYVFPVLFSQNTETFTVIATDRSLNANSDTSIFTIRYAPRDTTKPTITLLSPTEDEVLTEQTVTIRVEVQDNLSGIGSVIIAGKNADKVSSTANQYEADYAFTSGRGSYPIKITATDNPLGEDTANVQTLNVNLTYDPTKLDNTPPTVANGPAPSTQHNDTIWTETATFNFTADDENGISAAYLVHVEDAENPDSIVWATQTANGWTATIYLKDGANSIYIGAIDNSYNQNPNTATVNVTRAYPLSSIQVDGMYLTPDLFQAKPNINWLPANTTNKNYTVEVVGSTEYLTILSDKQTVLGTRFSGVAFVTCRVIPEADTTKAKEFTVTLDGGAD